MAYSARVSAAPRTVDGRSYIVYTIIESEARDTSEYELPDVPFIGTIVLLVSKLVSGTGTTIQPEIGTSSGWTDSTIDEVGRITSAAAFINEGSNLRCAAPEGSLWVRSSPNNAAADHVIQTVIVVLEGIV